MEVTTKKGRGTADGSLISRDLMIQHWHDLGRPPVDSRLLADIQNEMAQKLGGSDMESPASIARVLADEGADLRHPEIIESDAQWREQQIQSCASKFADIELWIAQSPLSLKQSEEFITTLEDRRQEFQSSGDDSGVKALEKLAIEARQNAQAIGANHSLDATVRAEQSEIDEWLKVWLQTPTLFENWLELRQRTEEFRRTFSHEDTESQRANR